MEMRQLRYFVQIVESGSLAKASRQLFIAQPALSQHMARLEHEVGKSLLVRSSRGVAPTENGSALYQHAKFLLRQLEETVAIARQEPAALSGRVTLGVGPTTACQLGVPFMEHLAAAYPAVMLNIIEGASGQLEYMVRMGQLDMAILFWPDAASDLQVEPLAEEELFVIVPRNSALVPQDQEALTLRQVSQLPLVLPSLRHALRQRRIELEFKRAGLPLDPIAEVDSLPLLMNWVERRNAATIQPYAAIRAAGNEPQRWRTLRIADVRVVRPNFLYALPDGKLSRVAAAVRDEMRLVVKRLVESGEWQGVTLPAESAAA
ncbi:LysR family transcriptional regulator [Ramlibacter sp. G-1-2-2]|uniref:LysR family transcriptional regulator n=1 Tax=Ramlibacter agri TaxID=2728837 RepID=A0A848H506_9BURK|nr:LysR substrate-binding domain-containing protein [Ramlibacter agri]NML42818.1 LysR family transcriptional regulator [Ramlibacter agri]